MIPMKGEAREAPLAIGYVKDSSGKQMINQKIPIGGLYQSI